VADAWRPIRVTFVVRVPGILKNFEAPLRLLAEQGHELVVAVERARERLPGQRAFIDALAAAYPNVTVETAGKREADGWGALAQSLRLSLDHLHYQREQFDHAHDYRRRAAEDAPRLIRRIAALPGVRTRSGRRRLVRLLGALESSMPISSRFDEFLREHRPDVLLVSPLIWFGAPQTEWIRAARRAGIPTAAAIYSWDNLTSKGAMREIPDSVLVWNPNQRREAVELHAVPEHRVVPTGAQNWDHWFERSPSRERAEFCARVGLDPDRPYVLYLESSPYVGGERAFLPEWLAAVRGSGAPALRDVSVLVRPHPQVLDEDWVDVVGGLEGVEVWPRAGREPLEGEARNDFFDSIHHCAATVGINTSAFIEAAILDKPSLSLILERFHRGQEGTVHFQYLREENGGPVRIAWTMDEHVEQLEHAVRVGCAGPAAKRFVEQFVRPYGCEVAAGPRFVAALEDLGTRSVRRPAPEPLWQRAARRVLLPVAKAMEPKRARGGPLATLRARALSGSGGA